MSGVLNTPIGWPRRPGGRPMTRRRRIEISAVALAAIAGTPLVFGISLEREADFRVINPQKGPLSDVVVTFARTGDVRASFASDGSIDAAEVTRVAGRKLVGHL